MYYVYVLESEINKEFYIGSTNNLRRRFEEHNQGDSISTKRYMPWKLIYYEAYSTEHAARMREKGLKNHGNAVRELKKRIYPAPLFRKSGAGFTLMELMIVMVIMGMLILIGLTSFMSSSQKGRDNRRKSDLRQIGTALEAYYSDKGKYPTDNGAGNMNGCGGNATALCNWGDTFSNTTNNTMYMVKLPIDPTSTLQYYYVSASGSNYRLYAKLENSQDLNLITPTVSTNCASSGTAVQCNWGIASPNTIP